MKKILQIKNLQVSYPIKTRFLKKEYVHAVNNITFDVYEGETLGIVGESGCGKSSLARSIIGLNQTTSGSITYLDEYDLTKKQIATEIQFIFQDPIASLNPRLTIGQIIAEPLTNLGFSKQEIAQKVLATMNTVGLVEDQLNCYPQELSGGQCQRVGIARALVVKPKLLICDESVSALDASVKAQIINLLKKLQKTLNLTIIFISHDLGIIKHICSRVLVMYLGSIMELSKNLYMNPRHPYTRALLSVIPVANPKLERQKKINILSGELPSATNLPKGCVFNTRCSQSFDKCFVSPPPLKNIDNNVAVACFLEQVS